MRAIAIPLVAAAVVLAGCGKDTPDEPDAATLQRVEALRPQEATLAAQYERSCMTCHASPGSGAPLAGFAAQWTPRLRQGIDPLVRHAMEGYNAMPAKGLCSDCTEKDMRALISFLVYGNEAKHD